MHAHAVGLHDGRRSITVDDKSGQMVTFTVHQPIGIVLGIVGYANGKPHFEGFPQPVVPKGVADGYVVERKNPHGDGPNLEMANGNEMTVGGDDTHDVALLDAFIYMLNGS